MGNICELSHGFELDPKEQSKIKKNKQNSSSLSTDVSSSKSKNCFKYYISNYDFYKCIGEGKFGMVFLAEHKKFKKKCAIKIIKKIKSNDLIKNNIFFETEKSLLKQMNHANIIKIYESFESKSHFFLVLEYAKYSDLRRFLNKNKSLSIEKIKFISAYILNALIYLHNKMNIIYRDLKPENILLGKNGIPKICDFGISKMVETTHTICGTSNYMSPEIMLSKNF